MSEKISFIPWNFVSPVCAEHGTPMIFRVKDGKVCLCCQTHDCPTELSVPQYGKLLEDVVSRYNSGKLVVKGKWNRKVAKKTYEFCLDHFIGGKEAGVSVRVVKEE